MLCAEHNIEVQVHLISIKQNSLADMLSCDQYTEIADRYAFIQIVKSIFGNSLTASI